MFDTKKFRNSEKTYIMGILNATPDSFSDGGEYFNINQGITRIQEMLSEGADIIDIGGESTRPGSEEVSEKEEIRRVIPLIIAARKKFGSKITISIDTKKAEVAKAAFESGADIMNTLGGFAFDKNLAKVAFKFTCPVIIYHIRGVPRTMQKGEIEYKDVIDEIAQFFKEQIAIGESFGVKKSQFIIDPGIGFGKTVQQNIEIVKRLSEFKKFKLPILIGASRKSHLGLILQEEFKLKEPPGPKERLEAALAETAIAVVNGATIVRTHDVLETRKFLSTLKLFF